MRAVDATLACLKRAGVDAIFGLPGGPVIPLFDALHDDPDIRTFLVRHEQGAGHMAEGYAKVTGRAGVCTATSGPGATNLVTPIADAYMDSVPLVAITGQVGSTRVGTDAFQEADIVGITLPIVKHSYLVKDADDLPRALAEALYVAQTGRARARCWWTSAWTSGRARSRTSTTPSRRCPATDPPDGAGHPRQIEAAARALAAAERPVIYAGGGIITGEASAELTQLSEVTGIPVNTTLMGLGGFPGTHPLFVGMPGMHGIAAATYAFQASDVILAVGRALRRAGAVDRHERVGAERQDHPHRRRPGRDLEEPGGPHRHRRPGRRRRWPRSPRPTRPCPSATTPARRAAWVDQIAALEAPAPLPGRHRGPRRHPAPAGRSSRSTGSPAARRSSAPTSASTRCGPPSTTSSTGPAAGSPRAGSGRWASACRRPSAPRWPCPTSW